MELNNLPEPLFKKIKTVILNPIEKQKLSKP